ncbi:hypothetical protein SDC9_125163 [bioreactor metagenome]|uniref:Uncharacterized protein n=1 Tax=bioreactor metagenome TaxID=1076179 RepID=A0A645CN09_9ZZZZ
MADPVDFFLDLLDGFHRVLFVIPLDLHFIEAVAVFGQLLLNPFQALFAELVLFFFEGGFLDFQLDHLTVDLIHLFGHGVNFGTDHGAGFIHQVDGLIREETVGNVPVGKHCRGDQGVILNLNPVEDFIAFL